MRAIDRRSPAHLCCTTWGISEVSGMKAKKTARTAIAKPTAARLVRGRVREEASFPVAQPRSELPRGYAKVLGEIKRRIQEERLRVVVAANAALVLLYWDIGRAIL